jgi:hypothetical protein
VFEDEACDPVKAVSAFKKLSSADDARYFIGPFCGSPQKALAPLLMRGERVVVLPSAAPESVSALSGNDSYSSPPGL